jgi:hypothetical protein
VLTTAIAILAAGALLLRGFIVAEVAIARGNAEPRRSPAAQYSMDMGKRARPDLGCGRQ